MQSSNECNIFIVVIHNNLMIIFYYTYVIKSSLFSPWHNVDFGTHKVDLHITMVEGLRYLFKCTLQSYRFVYRYIVTSGKETT